MDQLFWSHDPVIRVVAKQEQFIQDTIGRLRALIAEAVKPVNEYLGNYSKYMAFIELDVDGVEGDHGRRSLTEDGFGSRDALVVS